MLQAIFEYQTAICELTGMDVSNASGYDGTTVAADACFVAKHATGRSKIVVTEATNPQVRQVVKTYAPRLRARGRRGARTTAASTDPDRVREAAQRRGGRDLPAAELLRLPRSRARPRRRGERRRRDADRARRPRSSLGVLEAPGNYGCAMAIGEGQSAGNAMSYGGPHYGFLAARSDYIRRLPGRIVGETVDAAGERGYVLTLQTREQHIRREKATSNITTNQTLLALAGLVHLSLLGPQGLRELGETCMALAAYAKERLHERGPRARVSGAGNVQGVRGAHRTATRARRSRPRARRASTPATRSGATTRASTTRCSSPSPRSGTVDEIDRLVEALAA